MPCSGSWTQCGGIGFGGATCCVSGYTCQELNPYYSQCVPGTSPTDGPTTTTPSPAMTTTTATATSTTRPRLGECKSFCAQSSDNWSFKCSWDCCTGCSPCVATVTTTSSTASATTSTTATSTTPLPRVCKSWCADSAKPWTKKCSWDKCRGCTECGPPGRRLAVNTQHLSDAIFV